MQAKPYLPSTALDRNSQTFSDHNYGIEISSTGLIYQTSLCIKKLQSSQRTPGFQHRVKLSLDFLTTSSGQVSNRWQEPEGHLPCLTHPDGHTSCTFVATDMADPEDPRDSHYQWNSHYPATGSPPNGSCQLNTGVPSPEKSHCGC